MEAIQEENRAAEEKRHKITELQAKLRAEVEMRAKLDAEAKLKLQAEDEQGQELLAKARAEIEERILATGALPVLASVAPAVKQDSARVVSENEEKDLNEVSPSSLTACIMHIRVLVSAQDKVK
jgi:regulator of protease activity HflC (stomatin/prohibitin superfamily)